MRLRDDARGEWRVSDEDERLLVPRSPDERGGPFYRVLPEAILQIMRVSFLQSTQCLGAQYEPQFSQQLEPRAEGRWTVSGLGPEAKNIVDSASSAVGVGVQESSQQ